MIKIKPTQYQSKDNLMCNTKLKHTQKQFKSFFLWIFPWLTYVFIFLLALYSLIKSLPKLCNENFMVLANIGTYLTGLAAIGGLIKYGEYKQTEQESALISILSRFQYAIEYISEIISQPTLYQYDGYYPFSHSETSNSQAISHWERPPRLVQRALNELRIALYELSAKLKPNKTKQLEAIFNKLQKACNSICGRLQAEQFLDQKALAQYQSFDEYKQDLKNILDEIKKLFEDCN